VRVNFAHLFEVLGVDDAAALPIVALDDIVGCLARVVEPHLLQR